jgi:DDE_Tnp_1-associated/Transposase DDE domain
MKMNKKQELLQELKTLTDFRKDEHKIEYPLYEVVFMSLFGLLKGNVTYKDIHAWMQFQEENRIFKKLFKKDKVDVPSRSTLHDILTNIDNNELEVIFRNHFEPYVNLENIAIDGKWLRGSDVNGQYTQESHKSILNVLDKDSKIVIAHKFLEKGKLSEIPAFKELLDDKLFSKEAQVFSFDALLTQVELLNEINQSGRRYIAKVKGNQEGLKDKAQKIVARFSKPTKSYTNDLFTIEGNKLTRRIVDIFENKSCDLVMFYGDFNNIQTIIRVTKEVTDNKTGEIKTSIHYSIANFKADAKSFHDIILQHWRIETYHYHLDMLTKEDNHISYVNPFSVSILRAFAINLYQLYLNAHKGEKLMKSKVTMAEIKRMCLHIDDFTSDIFEANT